MWRLLLILVLGAGICGFLYANIWLLNEPYPTTAIAAAANVNGSQSEQTENGNDAEFQLALTKSVHTLSRPLFDPTRRPFSDAPAKPKVVAVAKPAVVESKPVERLDLNLMGMSATPEQRNALVAVDGGDAVWISEGEEINDWLVLSVNGEGITLKNGDRTEEYLLFPDSNVVQTE